MSTKYTLSNYNSTFEVKGSFYSIYIAKIGLIKCRNILTICRKNDSNHIQEDAIFVMMNPGSSKPKKGSNYGKIYTLNNFVKNGGHTINNLVDADPDNVHLYTMEIMDIKGWNKVIIVNLSDIREADSSKFKKKYRKIMKHINNKNLQTITSIFNSNRNERNIIFNNTTDVVVCWGANNPQYMTNDAIKFFNNNNITIKGLKAKKKYGYLYLKPRGRADKVNELVKVI